MLYMEEWPTEHPMVGTWTQLLTHQGCCIIRALISSMDYSISKWAIGRRGLVTAVCHWEHAFEGHILLLDSSLSALWLPWVRRIPPPPSSSMMPLPCHGPKSNAHSRPWTAASKTQSERSLLSFKSLFSEVPFQRKLNSSLLCLIQLMFN